VFLHFFRNTFGAADHIATTAAAVVAAFAAAGVIARGWGHLLAGLSNK